jgi:hypothetical protein
LRLFTVKQNKLSISTHENKQTEADKLFKKNIRRLFQAQLLLIKSRSLRFVSQEPPIRLCLSAFGLDRRYVFGNDLSNLILTSHGKFYIRHLYETNSVTNVNLKFSWTYLLTVWPALNIGLYSTGLHSFHRNPQISYLPSRNRTIDSSHPHIIPIVFNIPRYFTLNLNSSWH